MQGSTWINFFRRIPVNLHDSLALTVTTGAEIVLQGIIKLDDDFAIMRGRLSGTTEGARVVVIPYSMMVSIAFNRRMTDAEVQQVFGEAGPMAAPIPLAPAGAEPSPKEEQPEEPATVAPAVAPAAQAMPSKTMLLAKLRARLAEGGGQGGR
jgi:hypothetical protein